MYSLRMLWEKDHHQEAKEQKDQGEVFMILLILATCLNESFAEREKRMASMGLVTGKISFIGTRRVFGINNDSSQHGIFCLLQNLEESMEELNSIIQTLDKPVHRSLRSQKHKQMWNDMRTQLTAPIKKAISLDMLPLLLEKQKQ